MTTIHIPPEAVEAAARELAPHPWSMYTDGAKAHFQAKATAAIRAALENWPGVEKLCGEDVGPVSIILPLNTESKDD